MLEEIKKHSCDVYLILISNGIQMKSMLRYGDKWVRWAPKIILKLNWKPSHFF